MLDPILTNFLKRIKKFKQKIQAIYLFGSRARGTHRPDSDYDLLLVVTENFSYSDKDKLYDAVMEVLFDTGRLISLKIRKETEYRRLLKMKTPFMQNVLREGIKIG